MATVIYRPKAGEGLTEEESKMLDALDDSDITYDADCPELTDAQLSEFHAVHPELRADLSIFRPKKEQITIKLDADLVAAYRSTGRGYQTRINRDLRKAAEVSGIL